MNKIIIDQLSKLKDFNYSTQENTPIDSDFSKIIFYKKQNSNLDSIKVVFEDYIINPFPGFDLHDKWNNGIQPHSKIMYGNILKETEKMYQFSLHSDQSDKNWTGWCPKKSCHISRI